MFQKLLIANRGEIAVRIICAAKTLGISTVAIFSEADAASLHVRLADESVCVGPAPARQSYLNIDAVIAAAVESGADAIHPGYGFLSENDQLAARVRKAGLTFVGPDPSVIRMMSDKLSARAAAVNAGLPVLPGTSGTVEDVAKATELAEEIGFPVAVKACFGGGGRGMRVAGDARALEAAMASAIREAGAAFGRAEVFLERYLPRPRHVEVQIIGDAHGNVVHLGDRDCSVQRRHQKMIEEAPAPDLPDGLRSAILAGAVSLGRSVGYTGAGTVEFLVDPAAGDFYFLEVNTRLQVEHGVTELVSGIDIVELQLLVAAGGELPFRQEDVRINGHAIQARVSAEDAWEGFAPSTGRIDRLRLASFPWVRNDFGVEEGDFVQPHYDSMIGKVMAWATGRDAARRRLDLALERMEVHGVATTAPYARHVLDQPDFISVRHFTGSVESDWLPEKLERPPPAAQMQEETMVAATISERIVRLPGAAERRVAVYGLVEPGALQVIPSNRGKRSHSQTGNTLEGSASLREVRSPMDGVVVQVPTDVGKQVAKGQTILILEAMKMEVVIQAPTDGVIARIEAVSGAAVAKGQLLTVLE